MFVKDKAQVASRVGDVQRGVMDFGKLFGESNEKDQFQLVIQLVS